MSLLDPSTPAPDTATADQMKQLIQTQLFKAAGELDTLHRLLWRHGGSPTPQQVFDVFSTNGGKLIDVLTAYKDFITTLATKNGQTIDDYIASTQYTHTGTWTVGGGGAVTVT